MLHFILVFTAMISLLFFPSIFLIEQHEDMPLMSCKWSFFGSLLSFLQLVVIEETIWSEIINSFLDSPKNTQPRRTFSSLRNKRFRLVSEQKNTEEGDFRFWPRKKWKESQKVKEGEGEGKEGNACRQTLRFWKPAFAIERSAWLARLVEQYWHVSIKGLFHTERSCMVGDTRINFLWLLFILVGKICPPMQEHFLQRLLKHKALLATL